MNKIFEANKFTCVIPSYVIISSYIFVTYNDI